MAGYLPLLMQSGREKCTTCLEYSVDGWVLLIVFIVGLALGLILLCGKAIERKLHQRKKKKSGEK